MRMVSSCEDETIWKSSNWSRNTRPLCSCNSARDRAHRVPAGARGSRAAARSHTLILPS
ncbi:unnamed protein product [Ixodes hexagonus]